MSLDLRYSFIPLLISYVICIFIVPYINIIGKKYSIYDIPSSRKIHKEPKVRLGGVAIYTSFCVGIIISIFLFKDLYFEYFNKFIIFITLMVGVLSYFLLGLLDDIYKISFQKRLIIQFFMAFLIWRNDIRIDNLSFSFLPFDANLEINTLSSLILTLIWIVGIINAINWIDGLDGLSSGYVTIVCIAFLYLSFNSNNYYLVPIILSVIGTCLGFLKYNFFPSKILMGDGGSNFLGSFLAIVSLLVLKSPTQPLNLLPSIFLLSVPLIDMIFVILNRIINQKSPFLPDNNHIHHRILNLGLSQKNTVYTIYFVSIFISTVTCIIFRKI